MSDNCRVESSSLLQCNLALVLEVVCLMNHRERKKKKNGCFAVNLDPPPLIFSICRLMAGVLFLLGNKASGFHLELVPLLSLPFCLPGLVDTGGSSGHCLTGLVRYT